MGDVPHPGSAGARALPAAGGSGGAGAHCGTSPLPSRPAAPGEAE